MQYTKHFIRGSELLLIASLLAGGFAAGAAAQQKPEKSNMDLVGYNDLQNRSAYQPVIHKQGARWIAYVGHYGGQYRHAHPRTNGARAASRQLTVSLKHDE